MILPTGELMRCLSATSGPLDLLKEFLFCLNLAASSCIHHCMPDASEALDKIVHWVKMVGRNIYYTTVDPTGSIYKLNNRGSRIDPWGTPKGMLTSSALKLPIETEKDLPVK